MSNNAVIDKGLRELLRDKLTSLANRVEVLIRDKAVDLNSAARDYFLVERISKQYLTQEELTSYREAYSKLIGLAHKNRGRVTQ